MGNALCFPHFYFKRVKMKLPEIKKDLPLKQKMESLTKLKRNSFCIGPSTIGQQCQRKVFLNFRWFSKIYLTARIERLFERGNIIEKFIVEDLKECGVKFISTQQKALEAEGHIKAFCDGILENVPGSSKQKHVLEIKSSNEKTFNSFVKNGVEKTKFEYIVQIQIYMHLFKIKRGLFVIYNKNTDNLYFERIRYNKDIAIEYLQKGVEIINAKEAPNKIPDDKKYLCTFCDFKKVCFGEIKQLINCRTCTFSEPVKNGEWECQKKKIKLSIKKQKKGCKEHKQIKI